MTYTSFTIQTPDGTDEATVDLGLLHDALIAAGVDLEDGVSLTTEGIAVVAASDPTKIVEGLDWSALVPAPVMSLQDQIDDLKNQIASAVPALADIAVSAPLAPERNFSAALPAP